MLCPLLGELDPHLKTIAWAEAYLHTKWHLDPSSRLTTTNMGRKLGDLCPLGEEELGTYLAQCGRFRGLPPRQAEADLGIFSMFGRTGAPTKRGPHKRTGK